MRGEASSKESQVWNAGGISQIVPDERFREAVAARDANRPGGIVRGVRITGPPSKAGHQQPDGHRQ